MKLIFLILCLTATLASDHFGKYMENFGKKVRNNFPGPAMEAINIEDVHDFPEVDIDELGDGPLSNLPENVEDAIMNITRVPRKNGRNLQASDCLDTHVREDGQCRCPPSLFGDACDQSSECLLDGEIHVTSYGTKLFAEYTIVCSQPEADSLLYIQTCLVDHDCHTIESTDS